MTTRRPRRIPAKKEFFVVASERFIYGISDSAGMVQGMAIHYELPPGVEIYGPFRATSPCRAIELAVESLDVRLDSRMKEIYRIVGGKRLLVE